MTVRKDIATDFEEAPPQYSEFRYVVRVFFRRKLAVIGFIIIVLQIFSSFRAFSIFVDFSNIAPAGSRIRSSIEESGLIRIVLANCSISFFDFILPILP